MPHRYIWRRVRHFVVYRVLHADDTPHRIALGVAVGLFVAWTPTIGAQMALAVALATMVRANKLVPVPLVWLTNPFTMVPVYYANWLVGRALLPTSEQLSVHEVYTRLTTVAQHSQGLFHLFTNLLNISFWKTLLSMFLELGVQLWIGSLAVGAVLGAIGYVAVYQGVVAYRSRRRRRRERRMATAAAGRPVHRPDHSRLMPADESAPT